MSLNKKSPFHCPGGCHSGDFADFDHYFDVQGWKDGQEGEAFGCWLAGRFRIDITGGPVEVPTPKEEEA